MKIKDIIAEIETIAPPQLQESFDNSGLMVGDPDNPVTGILICLDVTMPVINEALANNINMIISHHPLIFNPIKKLNSGNPKNDIIIKAIKNDITIYSAHTNIDCSLPGVSQILGEKLGLHNICILQPKTNFLSKVAVYIPEQHADQLRHAIFNNGGGNIGNYSSCSFNTTGFGTFKGNEISNPFVGSKNNLHTEKEIKIEFVIPNYLEHKIIKTIYDNHPYEEPAFDIIPINNKLLTAGLGIVGELPTPCSEIEFIENVKQVLGLKQLKHSIPRNTTIKTVALCGGSGGSLIKEAISSKADAYLTAEIRHNEYIDYGNQILLADAGHYESESFIKNLISDIITKKSRNFAVKISEAEANPVLYT